MEACGKISTRLPAGRYDTDEKGSGARVQGLDNERITAHSEAKM